MASRIGSAFGFLTRISITFISMFLFASTPSMAAEISLAWDANDPPVDGYLLFIRSEGSGYDYASPVWSGVDTTCTIDDIADGAYSFVVRAYLGEVESADSKEIEAVVVGDLVADGSSDDGDVDGLDLVNYITGLSELDMEALAADFGCLGCQ